MSFIEYEKEIDDTDELIFGEEISKEGENVYDKSLDFESDGDSTENVYSLAISNVNAKSIIFNKTAIIPNKYDRWYKKLKEIIVDDNSQDFFEDDEEEEQPQQDIQMPRVLQALADLVERYRRNTNDILDPPIISKKKEQRILQRKNKDFMDVKGKQMVIAIVEHLEHLIIYGSYPKEMFGQYEKYAMDSIKSNGYESLHSGLKLLMCAEIIIPSAELIQPIKRISSALPTGVNP